MRPPLVMKLASIILSATRRDENKEPLECEMWNCNRALLAFFPNSECSLDSHEVKAGAWRVDFAWRHPGRVRLPGSGDPHLIADPVHAARFGWVEHHAATRIAFETLRNCQQIETRPCNATKRIRFHGVGTEERIQAGGDGRDHRFQYARSPV